MREPLSKTLKGMVGEDEGRSRTLNALLAGTGGRGIYLVLVFLALPFCLPILPGISTPFGIAIILLSLRKMAGMQGCLPRSVGDREFEPDTFDSILNGSVKILRWLEKVVHPRAGGWLGGVPARIVNSLVVFVMGILMALPLPVPLTNTIPAWAILIIAAATAETDGVLIWLGYFVALGAVVYFLFIWKFIVEAWYRAGDTWEALVEAGQWIIFKWSLVVEGLSLLP